MGYLGTMIIPRGRITSSFNTAAERVNYLQRVHAEHESIYQAIVNRDSETARAAMRTHLTNSRDRLNANAAELAPAETS